MERESERASLLGGCLACRLLAAAARGNLLCAIRLDGRNDLVTGGSLGVLASRVAGGRRGLVSGLVRLSWLVDWRVVDGLLLDVDSARPTESGRVFVMGR